MTIDMHIWQGRTDPEDGPLSQRWHQHILPADQANDEGILLLGFACDEGVSRNKGRTGAYDAPPAIRKALANLAWHHTDPIYDGGDILCNDGNLEMAQSRLAEDVCHALRQKHKVMVFGGGHEVAWGSFQGIGQYLLQKQHAGNQTCVPRIGIINFDAHFDLRNPPAGPQSERGSSGTPFHQIQRFCERQNWPFHYACFGINRAANTQALYQKADRLGVLYRDDDQLTYAQLPTRVEELTDFIAECDYLYLTIDLDVFPAAVAPGVSAPAARGVPLDIIEALLIPIVEASASDGEKKLLVFDIAEYNPRFDIDNQTARLAARLAWWVARRMR
ncbi:formimidoylglutamase [Photobacterium aphoticum]|uniref:Formimidoylglutamase n=1 Tax=Photobacterium aphoticum TaxID=754436 RepID=A0A0J1JAS3_9GAMM|nr:formimidoylglutamase [Photobacterium aphoticum]KLU98621.1 formimidoylglutamase [Photobacterium aphoticum]PSU57543.1 formimidoylglutamase [Photobacterium aphoticum]GHA62670.1 formimidoylglutamase [Photobacterium aphoticum]